MLPGTRRERRADTWGQDATGEVLQPCPPDEPTRVVAAGSAEPSGTPDLIDLKNAEYQR